MPRSRDQAGTATANTLQPTKLTSRRGAEPATLKLEDSRHKWARDMLLPEVMGDNGGGGDCGTNQDTKPRLDPGRAASKIGLGSVIFNLKPHHYHSGKKVLPGGNKVMESLLNRTRNKFPHIAKKYNPSFKVEKPVSIPEDVLCNSVNKLSLYDENCDASEGRQISKEARSMSDTFKSLVSQKILFESGQTVAVLVDEHDHKKKQFKKSSSAIRKAGVRNWKSPEASEDINHGTLRHIFSWALSTSTRWKEVEERIACWNNLFRQKSNNTEVSNETIADMLNVSVGELEKLVFYKDFQKVVTVLKNHICHTSLPWLTTLSALMELQNANHLGATQNAAESQGTFLHSEIVDKHVCYISRYEEPSDASNTRSSFSTKNELFRRQIQDTIGFAKNAGSSSSDDTFIKAISSFNPDWNIIQITAFMPSKNRFGQDLFGKRQIPQLLLSAMAQIPKEQVRSTFTTFCPDPPIYEDSMMRLGLMEEFQKILDRNLVISDDSVVISRKIYWEEREKHNQAMNSVIQAMEEEWIGPWNFLLPGHTTHRDIQDKIWSKIVSPAAKKYKLSSSQKLLLYKLTENYKYLHTVPLTGLETVLSFILKTPESGLALLCKKIREVGNEVPTGDRYPTILVVDQDLEIYPWESMSCLENTDVTRMPSVNLIRSNYNFVTSLRPSYPNLVDTGSCTVVLNPDGTLPNVQKRLQNYFLQHNTWTPVIGRPPLSKEIQNCLENQHVFLYNGHGAGSNFYPDYAVQKLVCNAVPLLMGCASAQSHYSIPRVYGSATIHSYFLAGCPSVVGYLWEITDAECDRITVDLIERWLPDENVRPPEIPFFKHDIKREREKCLPRAMRFSRQAATQYLTRCAIVCYGLPINTQD